MTTVYYTLEEISKNNGKDGNQMWIVVKNSVYNVTEIVKNDEHPGGVELIEEWAGTDASKAFNNAGHSGDAKNSLKNLKIGEVAEEDRNKKQTKSKSANEKSDQYSKSPSSANNDKESRRSYMSVLTCGLIG